MQSLKLENVKTMIFVVCNPPCIATEYNSVAHNDNNGTAWVLMNHKNLFSHVHG